MNRRSRLMLAVSLALLLSIIMSLTAAANPAAPGTDFVGPVRPETQIASPGAGPIGRAATAKPIDQPNVKDFQRNQERMRLLEAGKDAEAASLAKTADDRVLVILVEFAGTDTFTWHPGDHWDPKGIADPNEDTGTLGDCSKIINTQQTFTYSGPLHNAIPRPLSAEDRSGESIWTEDFSADWFKAFMWGDGVTFDYSRQDDSTVHEDFTGKSVKDYFLDMSGGEYEIAGDVIGWVQVPHSTWYYDADQCPGARSTSTSGVGRGVIPGAGNARTLVKDALDAVNAIKDTIPGFSWKNYDLNADGIIDRLWIVHAGYGEEDSTALLNRTDYSEAAVWSHSSAVTPAYPVGEGISAGPYIVMPENGGIGVFAHEYNHNLGGMDLYSYAGGETSTGFWSLSADDWTGYPIGYQPPSEDPMHLDWFGWLKPKVISDPGQVYEVTVGQASNFPGGTGVYRGVKIELPNGQAPLAVPVWQGARYWWGGKADTANARMTTNATIAIPAGGATLSFDLVYDIEDIWDFLWVQASEDGTTWTTLANANTSCAHDAGWIGEEYGFPADLCTAGIEGFTNYNASWPNPELETFDLAAFADKDIYLRLWYMTDWGTTGTGPFVDNVKVMAGADTLFTDDAETGDAKWTYEAPWQRSSGTQSFSHNYYLQWRNVSATGGYDSALGDPRFRYGPTNSGLLVWYNNNFYSDNEIPNYMTDFPGYGPKGRMLVVDANPEPYRDPHWVAAGYPNETANLPHRSSMRDAPFSKNDSVDFTVTPATGTYATTTFEGRPAVSAFHDALGYYPGAEFVAGGPVGQTTPRWITRQWDASTVVPAKEFYGVKAPGYAGSLPFRFDCARNAQGQAACYWYPSGLGFDGGSGNPGDQLAQYGWHVQVVSQTDSTARLRIWNSTYEIDGSATQAPPRLQQGDLVTVAVDAMNVGAATDAFVLVPLSPNVAYVDGSATNGAYPVPVSLAGALAKDHGVKGLVIPEGAASTTVVGVAYDAANLAAGDPISFDFQVAVTAESGSFTHSAYIYQAGQPSKVLESNTISIVPGQYSLFLPWGGR